MLTLAHSQFQEDKSQKCLLIHLSPKPESMLSCSRNHCFVGDPWVVKCTETVIS